MKQAASYKIRVDVHLSLFVAMAAVMWIVAQTVLYVRFGARRVGLK